MDFFWGWMKPSYELCATAITNWLRKRRLRKALESYSEGRTLEALRREAGEADTEEGREKTRALLRAIRRGNKQARILMRSGTDSEEMWGLR